MDPCKLAIDAFILTKQADGCSPKTLAWHRQSLTTLHRWLIANDHPLDPEDWSTMMLRTYVVYLQSTDLKPSSVTTKVQSLLVFTRWLHEEELTATNVGARVKKPNAPLTQKQPFTEDELKRLIDAADTLRDKAILYVLIDTGIRVSELVGLTRDKVLLDQNLLVVFGKGQKERVVPMSIKTSLMMRKLLMKTHDHRVFMGRKGGWLTTNGVQQLLNRLAHLANVENVHPHRFRHTYAISMLRNGSDSLVLQRLLGHTTLTMTNHYVNMVHEDLQREHATASPITKLLGGAAKGTSR